MYTYSWQATSELYVIFSVIQSKGNDEVLSSARSVVGVATNAPLSPTVNSPRRPSAAGLVLCDSFNWNTWDPSVLLQVDNPLVNHLRVEVYGASGSKSSKILETEISLAELLEFTGSKDKTITFTG